MIFETSILEMIAKPLAFAKVTPDVRQPYVYEHVFTPVILAPFLALLPGVWKWIGLAGLAGFHLVAKELVYDPIKNGNFNVANVIERAYGLALAAGVIALC